MFSYHPLDAKNMGDYTHLLCNVQFEFSSVVGIDEFLGVIMESPTKLRDTGVVGISIESLETSEKLEILRGVRVGEDALFETLVDEIPVNLSRQEMCRQVIHKVGQNLDLIRGGEPLINEFHDLATEMFVDFSAVAARE